MNSGLTLSLGYDPQAMHLKLRPSEFVHENGTIMRVKPYGFVLQFLLVPSQEKTPRMHARELSRNEYS